MLENGVLEPAGALPVKTKLEALAEDEDQDVKFYAGAAIEVA